MKTNTKMFDFNNYSTKPKCFTDSNKLVVGKMKDRTAGVGIEEFVGLKPKMYSYLVDDNSEHKKAKSVNKNVATISHGEYKDTFLIKSVSCLVRTAFLSSYRNILIFCVFETGFF